MKGKPFAPPELVAPPAPAANNPDVMDLLTLADVRKLQVLTLARPIQRPGCQFFWHPCRTGLPSLVLGDVQRSKSNVRR
jgi:hypothetical protein